MKRGRERERRGRREGTLESMPPKAARRRTGLETLKPDGMRSKRELIAYAAVPSESGSFV